jgi:hypothetical protein
MLAAVGCIIALLVMGPAVCFVFRYALDRYLLKRALTVKRLIPPKRIRAADFQYRIPEGFRVLEVFDFNVQGHGIPVAYETPDDQTIVLPHTPACEDILALCESATIAARSAA